MQNAVTQEQHNLPSRDIGIITAEIKEICRQAQSMALMYAIEIGRRLVEAKNALPYGKWGEWLKNEVNFSQSTANNFMRLFEEYGSAQISIFGAVADSQTFANLPYSKALQLLAVPSEEREQFAEKVKADELSVKELQAAIRERDEARRQVEEAQAREEALREKYNDAEKAKSNAIAKASEAYELKQKLDNLTKKYADAREEAAIISEKLKKAQEDPTIPPEKLKKIKQEAEAAARRQQEAESEEEIEAAKKAAEEAEAARFVAEKREKEARERLAEAEKRLKTANPEVTTFKTLFDTFQEMAFKLRRSLDKIKQDDAETAQKLETALKAVAQNITG